MVPLRTICLVLGLPAAALAQEPAAPGAGVSGIQGVEQKAIESIRKVEPNATQPVAPTVAPQGVNKVDGIDTIAGVKATGHEAITPPPPPPPPPPASVSAPTVGSASSIQAVKGVAGLNVLKRENLEAALNLKENDPNAPKHTGKAQSAAAALLGAPLGKPVPQPAPKDDGRAGFQEFEKLNTTGS